MIALAGMVALAAAGGGDLVAGPVPAGDGAAWATRTRSGAVRLVTRRPGGEPKLITRFTTRRLRTGAFGVGPRTVVWAEQPAGGDGTYEGAARIVLERL